MMEIGYDPAKHDKPPEITQTGFWVVPLLSVVPLKIGNNNCKPGETYRKMPSICKIPTLYRANFAEDRHQHSRGGLSRFV
jgi:hypothetical protein